MNTPPRFFAAPPPVPGGGGRLSIGLGAALVAVWAATAGLVRLLGWPPAVIKLVLLAVSLVWVGHVAVVLRRAAQGRSRTRRGGPLAGPGR